MTGYRKIFLDTSPFIYYFEQKSPYFKQTAKIFDTLYKDGGKFITSTVTCMEYLVYPYRTKNLKAIDIFWQFIEAADVRVANVNKDIAIRAAQIRAEYVHFKPMDSIQLAAACMEGCDLFLTNDKQLEQFTEIDCLILSEYQSGENCNGL